MASVRFKRILEPLFEQVPRASPTDGTATVAGVERAERCVGDGASVVTIGVDVDGVDAIPNGRTPVVEPAPAVNA